MKFPATDLIKSSPFVGLAPGRVLPQLDVVGVLHGEGAIHVASRDGSKEVPSARAEHEAEHVAPRSCRTQTGGSSWRLSPRICFPFPGSLVDQETDAALNLDRLDQNGQGLLESGEKFLESHSESTSPAQKRSASISLDWTKLEIKNK